MATTAEVSRGEVRAGCRCAAAATLDTPPGPRGSRGRAAKVPPANRCTLQKSAPLTQRPAAFLMAVPLPGAGPDPAGAGCAAKAFGGGEGQELEPVVRASVNDGSAAATASRPSRFAPKLSLKLLPVDHQALQVRLEYDRVCSGAVNADSSAKTFVRQACVMLLCSSPVRGRDASGSGSGCHGRAGGALRSPSQPPPTLLCSCAPCLSPSRTTPTSASTASTR